MLVYGELAVICAFGIAGWLLSLVGSLLVVRFCGLVRGVFVGFVRYGWLCLHGYLGDWLLACLGVVFGFVVLVVDWLFVGCFDLVVVLICCLLGFCLIVLIHTFLLLCFICVFGKRLF